MKLENLVKTVDEMTDAELLTRLREIRHSRDVVRPASRQRVEKVEARASRGKVTAVDKLLAKLTPAEREKLMEQLGEAE